VVCPGWRFARVEREGLPGPPTLCLGAGDSLYKTQVNNLLHNMLYPKYLETEDRQLLVFPASETHSNIARAAGGRFISGGFVSAARHPRGKFFGESSSTRLMADRNLDWSGMTWHQGTLGKFPVFGTDAAMLTAIGAKSIRPAPFCDHEGLIFPSDGRIHPAKLASFFLP
jgi:hypothetical protein